MSEENTGFYVYEKLFIAVDILATHPGTIRDRLWDAELSALSRLEPETDHFATEECRNDFKAVYAALHVAQTWGDEGQVRASLNELDDDTAVDIAKKIFSVFICVQDARRGSED
jgi:hypothetical protein